MSIAGNYILHGRQQIFGLIVGSLTTLVMYLQSKSLILLPCPN